MHLTKKRYTITFTSFSAFTTRLLGYHTNSISTWDFYATFHPPTCLVSAYRPPSNSAAFSAAAAASPATFPAPRSGTLKKQPHTMPWLQAPGPFAPVTLRDWHVGFVPATQLVLRLLCVVPLGWSWSFPQEPPQRLAFFDKTNNKNVNILNLKMRRADRLCLWGWYGSGSGSPTSQPPTAPLKSDPDTNLRVLNRNLLKNIDFFSLAIWGMLYPSQLSGLQPLTHFQSKRNGWCYPPRN